MGLVEITEDSQIDSLEKGDRVKFFTDMGSASAPWQDEVVFFNKDLAEMTFLARAINGENIYEISYCRPDLYATDSGAIGVRDGQTFSSLEITPKDLLYELYGRVINECQSD